MEDLAQVQVDPEADGDEVGEEENKAEHVVVPGTVESLQDDHDQGQHHRSGKQHLRKYPTLKGQCHEIFDLYFFPLIEPIWSPDKQAKMVFIKNSFSRRYSNLKIEKFDSAQC